jgi:hypothetical protein
MGRLENLFKSLALEHKKRRKKVESGKSCEKRDSKNNFLCPWKVN